MAALSPWAFEPTDDAQVAQNTTELKVLFVDFSINISWRNTIISSSSFMKLKHWHGNIDYI